MTVAGDHSIVVGEVLNAGLREGRDGSGETPAALVYYRSSYGQLA